MPASEYLRIVRRHLLLVVLSTLLVGGAVAVWTSQRERVYAASTQLIVAVEQGGAVSGGGPDGAQLAMRLSQLAGTPPAVADAEQRVGVRGVVTGVESTGGDGSSFLDIALTGTEPVALAEVANTFAATLPETARELEQLPPGIGLTLTPLRPAVPDPTPVSPRPVRDIGLGLFAGLVLGLAGAFTRSALDRRLGDSNDVEELTGLSVLGAVPYELRRERLPSSTHPASVRSEAYRLVRTNLQFADAAGGQRTLLVTSPTPGDGKTSVATNVAVSCALAGERVVIVDADLRRPRVAQQFQVDGARGLVQLLEAGGLEDVQPLLQDGAEGVRVLPAGGTPRGPSELLGRPAMAIVLDRLARDFDRVIVDAPPVLPVADAVRLAAAVGGVLLVARTGHTTRDDVLTSLRRLEKASARVLGVVANGVRPSRDSAYGYGSFGDYTYGGDAGRRGARRRRGG